MHLVMIGGSDAGISAALRAREVDPGAEVTVVAADAYPNFSICGIPYYVSGEVTHWRNLAHRTTADLEATGMRLRLDTTARRIDPGARKLLVTGPDGAEDVLGYDKLIVGTGAVPIRPPIGGLTGPGALGPGDGVHLLHSMGDTFAVMRTLETTAPATVVVIGAGVAGLQAIATARRLGAVVSAYDLRPAAKEQVQSLGGRFVELPIEAKDAQDAGGYAKAQDEDFYRRQRELLGKVVAENDVVITAAVVPGKKSPVLVTREMVAGMAPGSVIVDLAAERGGNCELTKAGEVIAEHGVTIVGLFNLATAVPYHASQMYAKNITAFLQYMVKDGKLVLNLDDEIIQSTLVTHGGEVVNSRVREFFSLPPLVAEHKERR